MLNVAAVSKIVSSWKTRFVLERGMLDDLEKVVEVRKASLYALSPGKKNLSLLSTSDMQRRIEEDRERHKSLRERSWILPPTAFSHQSLFGTRPEQLDPTYLTRRQQANPRAEEEDTDGDRIWTTQDLDFSQMWEETSDFNDDDVEEIRETEKVGWVNQPPPPPPQQQEVVQQVQQVKQVAVAATPVVASAQVQQQQQMQMQMPPRAPASMRMAQRHF